jgi:hypothetical protein
MRIKINPLMLLAIAAQTISIYYSFTFFNDINTFFGVLIVLFEITLFIFAPLIKEAKNIVIKGVMITVVILVASFSILGVVANGYNFILQSNSDQYKTIVSDSYLNYKEQLKELQSDKIELQSQLIKYPSLESTISSLKSWENKQETINNWNIGYNKISEEIKKSKEKIATLKVPKKTKLIRKNIKGYNSIFKLTGIKEETCIFWLTFIIAVILQFIILTARLYKNNEVRAKNPNPKEKNPNPPEVRTPDSTHVEGVRAKEVRAKNPNPIINLEEVRAKNPNPIEKNPNPKEKILTQIEEYIIKNFSLEELINRKKLLEDLEISEYEWKKLDKSKINNIEKIGTKFKRVN